ncbi:hypothetical protein GJ496_010303 [Pomphorhynchus laevis]|nr:hypothetical protein GJ496_010303 [Pomphorhynchus laevis]
MHSDRQGSSLDSDLYNYSGNYKKNADKKPKAPSKMNLKLKKMLNRNPDKATTSDGSSIGGKSKTKSKSKLKLFEFFIYSGIVLMPPLGLLARRLYRQMHSQPVARANTTFKRVYRYVILANVLGLAFWILMLAVIIFISVKISRKTGSDDSFYLDQYEANVLTCPPYCSAECPRVCKPRCDKRCILEFANSNWFVNNDETRVNCISYCPKTCPVSCYPSCSAICIAESCPAMCKSDCSIICPTIIN